MSTWIKMFQIQYFIGYKRFFPPVTEAYKILKFFLFCAHMFDGTYLWLTSIVIYCVFLVCLSLEREARGSAGWN